MTDPFTSQGLQDRSREMVRDTRANHIPILEVDELIIGGTRIFAEQGTRYANGGLTIQGRDDNSVEIRLKPGDACKGKGVTAQIIWYAQHLADSFRRFAISIVNDGTDTERVVVDSSSHESVSAMPVYMPVMGAKSRSDGTDVPNSEKLAFSYFWNGSHEFHLKNDTLRVEIASFVEAFIANDKSLMVARQKRLSDGVWEPVHFTNDHSFDNQ